MKKLKFKIGSLKAPITLTILILFTLSILAQDSNVLIGLNSPAYGVKIKTNFPGYNGGWARGFIITNRNNTEDYIQFGALGVATNGVTTLSYGYIGKKYNDTYMVFKPSGKKIGIGTNDPLAKLDVNGRAACHTSFTVGKHDDNHRGLVIDNAGSYGWNLMELKNVQGSKMIVKGNGNVGIGTTAPTKKLHVQGDSFLSGKVQIGNVSTTSNQYDLFVEKGILTEQVKVAVKSTGEWSDYVFEEDYNLMPLRELENYVSKNKHLPNVPSAEEVVKEGINMAKMDAKLLEKIEEAYLYIIELKQEVEQLKTQVNSNQ